MADLDDSFEQRAATSKVRSIVIPLLVLLAFVATVGALVLSGAVQGQQPRTAPEQVPTTRATVEIGP